MNRAVFLDRDGVINCKAPEGEYITRLQDLVFLPRVTEAVQILRSQGFLIIVVTNQRGVSRGKITLQDLEMIHQAVARFFSTKDAPLDGIYFCPHEGGCECRKPAPGMLLDAALEHKIDLRGSWLVGDSLSDIQAGKQVGCSTVLISAVGPESHPDMNPDFRANSLWEAANLIVHADLDSCRSKPEP